jgi:hypothetical protein
MDARAEANSAGEWAANRKSRVLHVCTEYTPWHSDGVKVAQTPKRGPFGLFKQL